jgi:hypothetical protein
MLTFIESIGRQEGVLIPGSKAQRRNNPGNIEEGKFAQAHGALPTDGDRFAAWATLEAGYAAMRALLTIGYLGLTVAEALNKWAPASENDVNTYLANVIRWTGMSADTILDETNIG